MRKLIIEADGGSRGNPGPAAFGALVRAADTGEVLAESGETIGVATNNVAEYRGLISGLRMARAIDPSAQVEARLDSKLVVEQMSGRWKIKHPDMRPLALEAQRIFPPGQVIYTWVPRERNKHADRLLNEALDGKPMPEPSPDEPRVTRGHTGDDAPQLPTEPEPSEPSVQETGRVPAADEKAAPPHRLITWSPELGPPTTFVFVRHGQTAMTRARAFSGGDVEGPPLDDVGRGQVQRAAAMLAASELMADTSPVVVASPMLRTRQTAEAIASSLGVEKVNIDDEWRECEFGAWDGLTLAQITERFPDEVAAWFDSTSHRPPGGESLDDMSARIRAARDRAIDLYQGQTVVVATHSMPVRALVRMALDAPPSAMYRLQPTPGSVTEIQHYSDGTVALTGFNHRP